MVNDKLEKVRSEIEKAYNEAQNRVKLVKDEYWEGKVDAYRNVLCIFDSIQEETKISGQEEPVNNDFEMALAEMIDKAQTSVVEPLVIAAQWEDELIKLAKSEEPVSEDLEEAVNAYIGYAPEVDESSSTYGKRQAFKAGANWLSNMICSEIEKRLQYMQYAPHRADTYKELKSLLAYIKSYV